jgi:capsular polysaccharide biosynthesis protein
MEIMNFLKQLKNNILRIFLVSLIFSGISFGFYLILPELYIAEGTLFAYPINNSDQKSEVSNEMNYSRNLIALSNSPEFKNLIKSKNFTKLSFSPLIGVVGPIRLKEVSPNILSLSVTGETRSEVTSNYKDYVEHLIEFSNILKKGNSSFELSTISDTPNILKVEKNIYLFLAVGFIFGLFVSCIYFFIKKK